MVSRRMQRLRKQAELKVVHLCYSEGDGGAGLGARRLHLAMLKQGVKSRLLVANGEGTEGVVTLADVGLRKAYSRVFRKQLNARDRFRVARPLAIRSINLFDYGISHVLNRWDCDVIQMHWVGNGFMPIRELAKIRKPLFWKLPDMWAFSGAEHYRDDIAAERHIGGYASKGGVADIPRWGRDMDAITWRLKQRCWADLPLTVITPSRWLGREAYMSSLFRDYDVHVIPNPLDTMLYAPITPEQKAATRRALGLPVDRHVMAFSAFGTEDPRKGYHHLQTAIESHLAARVPPSDLSFLIIGSRNPGLFTVGSYQVMRLGQTANQVDYARTLAAADSFVLPTEIDNLPNTVTEAMACGLPTVAFNVGGVPDQIDHLDNGYIVSPFDREELARGIAWVVQNPDPASLSESARRRAVAFCDESAIVDRYLRLYDGVMQRARSGLAAIKPSGCRSVLPTPPVDDLTFPPNPTQSPSLNDHAIISLREGKGRFHDSRFAMSDTKRPRIVILDPASIRAHDTTHNATYVRTISESLVTNVPKGMPPRSIDWVVNGNAELENPFGEVLPLFPYSPYDDIRRTTDITMRRRVSDVATAPRVWDDCIGKQDRDVFDVLRKVDEQLGGLDSRDCIFVPMLDRRLLDGLIMWLCTRGTLFAPSVHIMVMYENANWMTGGYPFENMMLRLRNSQLLTQNVFLYTETAAFGKALRERFGAESARLVYPVKLSGNAARLLELNELERLKYSMAESGEIRIAVLGRGRRDKGFALLPDTVGAFTLRYTGNKPVRFVIQDGRAMDDLGEASNRLKLCGNVTLLDESLSDGEFEAEQDRADIVLLPYDQNVYAERGSSIMWRAVANAKPLVVTAGTGLVEAITHENGLAVPASPIALADALVEIVENIPKWRLGALSAARAYWSLNAEYSPALSRTRRQRGDQVLVIDAGEVGEEALKKLRVRGYRIVRWMLLDSTARDDEFVAAYHQRGAASDLQSALELATTWRKGEPLEPPELVRTMLENKQVDIILHDAKSADAAKAMRNALSNAVGSQCAPRIDLLATFASSAEVERRSVIDQEFELPRRNPAWRRFIGGVEKRLKPKSRAHRIFTRLRNRYIKPSAK